MKRGFQSKDEVSIDKALFLTEGVKIREKRRRIPKWGNASSFISFGNSTVFSCRVVRKEEINDEENNSFYCHKSIALRLCL